MEFVIDLAFAVNSKSPKCVYSALLRVVCNFPPLSEEIQEINFDYPSGLNQKSGTVLLRTHSTPTCDRVAIAGALYKNLVSCGACSLLLDTASIDNLHALRDAKQTNFLNIRQLVLSWCRSEIPNKTHWVTCLIIQSPGTHFGIISKTFNGNWW